MCEQTRQQAYDLLIDHARAIGANAIVGLRYDASEIGGKTLRRNGSPLLRHRVIIEPDTTHKKLFTAETQRSQMKIQTRMEKRHGGAPLVKSGLPALSDLIGMQGVALWSASSANARPSARAGISCRLSRSTIHAFPVSVVATIMVFLGVLLASAVNFDLITSRPATSSRSPGSPPAGAIHPRVRSANPSALCTASMNHFGSRRYSSIICRLYPDRTPDKSPSPADRAAHIRSECRTARSGREVNRLITLPNRRDWNRQRVQIIPFTQATTIPPSTAHFQHRQPAQPHHPRRRHDKNPPPTHCPKQIHPSRLPPHILHLRPRRTPRRPQTLPRNFPTHRIFHPHSTRPPRMSPESAQHPIKIRSLRDGSTAFCCPFRFGLS